MDQLEKKLTAPATAQAGDAEEYSEQLDLLERLMEGSGAHMRIETIARYLSDANIVKSSVAQELDKLTQRRQQLMPGVCLHRATIRNILSVQAAERRTQLEQGVHDSQQFERHLNECRSWMTHMDCILRSRLDTDVLAADLPEEYKVDTPSFHTQFYPT
jgi:hypothetical protein